MVKKETPRNRFKIELMHTPLFSALLHITIFQGTLKLIVGFRLMAFRQIPIVSVSVVCGHTTLQPEPRSGCS